LVQLIDPSSTEFNFNGYSKFVVNASELLNRELSDLLYSVPNKIPDQLV
jgi:hypothetical protein